MGFKPRDNRPTQTEGSGDSKPFVVINPKKGLQVVQLGLLVDLGKHKKQPKFAKDSANKREQDEAGNDKILWPIEGRDLEQRVAAYVDLLSQKHDYEGEIGVRNIRLPLHEISRGLSQGLNFTTVAPRDPNGNYIKGRQWLVAGTSQWAKIAGVTQIDENTTVADKMLNPDYKNKDANNIELLLGKPFMFNLEVKTEVVGDKTYVNTKFKSPVPLMDGMPVPDALQAAVSVNFDDEDLLEAREDLGGICKLDLLRLSDLRKIVLAEDYEGSNMQKAVQEKYNEDDLIAKGKEIQQKILESDKDLIEIRELYPNGKPEDGEAPAKVEAKIEAEAAKPKKPSKPQAAPADDDGAPF